MPAPTKAGLENRELSWLAFNERVLEEARDPDVPLLERIYFLAIFSSNLDEFFRVRVASIRSLLRLKKKTVRKLDFNPARLVRQIHQIVSVQQEAFGTIFRNEIFPALAAERVFLIDETQVTPDEGAYLERYFDAHVRPHLTPIDPVAAEGTPFLKNRCLYLITECWDDTDEEPAYALIEVPSPPLGRFVELPVMDGARRILFLDDVIRYNLPRFYPDTDLGNTFSVKLSRDADLYLEDEFTGDLVQIIKKSLRKRETGVPCRFLYDQKMPFATAALLKERLGLQDRDMVLGGRYHNLHDLFYFPSAGLARHRYPELPPLDHPDLAGVVSLFTPVREKDRLLLLPYQKFEYVVRFLQDAAADPLVSDVWISLYRVAPDSAVARALIEAARNGKRVHAFIEVKARFDEASNLSWAERLEPAGVQVHYSLPGLKVHAKMALVVRSEPDGERLYAYLGTGNFNENTARFYTDLALLTADPRLTREVQAVFSYLTDGEEPQQLEHLLVAPFTLREGLYRLIENEIDRAQAGEEAWIVLKLNNLEDEAMIERLYRAADAGVRLRIIVRGICRLVPGMSDRILATGIVDRFLEHARLFVFGNGGAPLYFGASADLMTRNLSHRVEVAFPIYDADLQADLRAYLDLQQRDNLKARLIGEGRHTYYRPNPDVPVRSQIEQYRLMEARLAAEAEVVPSVDR